MSRGRVEDDPEQTDGPAAVAVTNAAVEFIRAHGGAVYVWIDSAGLLQSKTKPPSEFLHWDTRNADGVRVCLSLDLPEVRYWHVALRKFPWKHIDVTSSESPPPANLIDAVLAQNW
jgi:hypothetical protein